MACRLFGAKSLYEPLLEASYFHYQRHHGRPFTITINIIMLVRLLSLLISRSFCHYHYEPHVFFVNITTKIITFILLLSLSISCLFSINKLLLLSSFCCCHYQHHYFPSATVLLSTSSYSFCWYHCQDHHARSVIITTNTIMLVLLLSSQSATSYPSCHYRYRHCHTSIAIIIINIMLSSLTRHARALVITSNIVMPVQLLLLATSSCPYCYYHWQHHHALDHY